MLFIRVHELDFIGNSSFGRLDVDQNHVLSYTTLAERLTVGGVVIEDMDFRRLTRTGPVARRRKRDNVEEPRKYAVLDREQFREVCCTVPGQPLSDFYSPAISANRDTRIGHIDMYQKSPPDLLPRSATLRDLLEIRSAESTLDACQ
jgi:hypothetical protein